MRLTEHGFIVPLRPIEESRLHRPPATLAPIAMVYYPPGAACPVTVCQLSMQMVLLAPCHF